MSAGVLAHNPPATPQAMWPPDPVSVGVTVVALAAVMLLVRLGHHRGAPDDGRRRGAFALGASITAAAIASPLHGVADVLFAVHMGQHLLLVAAAAPLLVWGAPAVLARPRPSERRPSWSLPLATVAMVVTFTMWHAPVLYEAAVRHAPLHGVEHVTMSVAALGYWAAIAAATSRNQDLAALGAIAVSGLPGVALGALLALSADPWYAVHHPRSEAWGLGPLEDQQLGGMLMWVVGGAINLAAACLVVIRHLNRAESSPSQLRPVPPVP